MSPDFANRDEPDRRRREYERQRHEHWRQTLERERWREEIQRQRSTTIEVALRQLRAAPGPHSDAEMLRQLRTDLAHVTELYNQLSTLARAVEHWPALMPPDPPRSALD